MGKMKAKWKSVLTLLNTDLMNLKLALTKELWLLKVNMRRRPKMAARWCQECSPRSTVFHQMPRQRMLSPTCLLMGSLSSLLLRRTWLSNKNEEYDLKINHVNQLIIYHNSFHV